MGGQLLRNLDYEQLLFTKKEFFKRLQCGAGGKSARFLAGVSHAEYSVSI